MCYAYPGPRCASHISSALKKATSKLQTAQSNGDQKLISSLYFKCRDLKQEYYSTASGQKKLSQKIKKSQDAGEDAEVRKLQFIKESTLQQRQQKLNDYNFLKENNALLLSTNSKVALIRAKKEDDFPEHKLVSVIKDYELKYGEPSIGRTRAVFDTQDGYVVKIPFTWEGLTANASEVHHSSEASRNNFIPLALSKWHTQDNDDLGMMKMEKVEIITSLENLPDWAGYVDCAQVGRTKDGRIVAYDL